MYARVNWADHGEEAKSSSAGNHPGKGKTSMEKQEALTTTVDPGILKVSKQVNILGLHNDLALYSFSIRKFIFASFCSGFSCAVGCLFPVGCGCISTTFYWILSPMNECAVVLSIEHRDISALQYSDSCGRCNLF